MNEKLKDKLPKSFRFTEENDKRFSLEFISLEKLFKVVKNQIENKIEIIE
ncbi:MAG: hypothetical protein QXL51_01505 [Candidatus Aenigmatarchaeota archaeon]